MNFTEILNQDQVRQSCRTTAQSRLIEVLSVSLTELRWNMIFLSTPAHTGEAPVSLSSVLTDIFQPSGQTSKCWDRQCWAGRRWSRYSPPPGWKVTLSTRGQFRSRFGGKCWRWTGPVESYCNHYSLCFSLIHLVSVSHENHQDFSRFQSECFTSFKSQKMRWDQSEILLVFPSARPHIVLGCQAWPGVAWYLFVSLAI